MTCMVKVVSLLVKKIQFCQKVEKLLYFLWDAPSYAFLIKLFLSNTFFLESKIEEKNDNAKVDKVGDRTGTEGAFSC